MILRRDQLREAHIRGVGELLHWKEHGSLVENNLFDDLQPDRWSDLHYPREMVDSFLRNQDKYVEQALCFLTEMYFTYIEYEDLAGTIPRVFHQELIGMEWIYLMAMFENMFFSQTDDGFWCVQIYETGTLKIPHIEPWISWNQNCWLVALDRAQNSDFFSPAICRLEFHDGVKFLRHGAQLDLMNQERKLIAPLDSRFSSAHTLTAYEYERFAPVLQWHGCLYSGFADGAVRLEVIGEKSMEEKLQNGGWRTRQR